MYFLITGTSQHFSRMVINVDQNNIGLFHKSRYINIRKKQQNEKVNLGLSLRDALNKITRSFYSALIMASHFWSARSINLSGL